MAATYMGGYFMNFIDVQCFIEGNKKLREPQVLAYLKIKNHFDNNTEEALVVLPTGTGKSGLISIAPYKVCKKRLLVITPGTVTRKSISKTMDILEDNFWINYNVIFDVKDLPVVIGYENEVLDSELNSADIIYTNVQKLSLKNKNSLLNRVDKDFFDMIIVDEAHHAPANTWQAALSYFSNAKVLHVTGTPYRGDGIKVPGKLIYEAKLSEVMEEKLVKWLRNKTITAGEIKFIDNDGQELTIEEAKALHDEEWVSRTIAMTDECSLEIVRDSIKELKELKQHSSKVPHKILAAACNIKHGERLLEMYKSEGMRVVLIHSKQPKEEIDRKFQEVEQHKYDVVVNIGMMVEGYDHPYLTIAALFRPYRSLNMFAQIVGRVLRVIPKDEITKHEIDNNALVIYHKELGLDKLWDYFRREVQEAGRYKKVKEIEISDSDYENRETLYGTAVLLGDKISYRESYSDIIDFNLEYEKAKQEIDNEVQQRRKQLQEMGLSEDEIDDVIQGIVRRKQKDKSDELYKIYNEKRPLERRKLIKKMLKQKIELLAVNILEDLNIDEKGNTLYNYLKKMLPQYVKDTTKNDGVVVIFINTKLSMKFGSRNELDIPELERSEEYLLALEKEVKKVLRGATKSENY